MLSEIGVMLAEIAEFEIAGLALSILTAGASEVASNLMAGERALKVVALVGRIEEEGTALGSVVRGVMEVIRGVERALKALKEIRGVAEVGKMAAEGAKFSAFETLLKDPGAFKDPDKLAGILTEGALMGVGFGALGKALGKGLKALKPSQLAELAKGMKLNCAAFERLKLNPAFDKLPASVGNMVKKFVRDPIDVATGDMSLPRTDVTLPGVLPLVLERTHLSSYRWGGWFGPSWASTLDQRVQADDDGFVYATADGARLCFPHPDAETGEPVRPDTPGSGLTLCWDTETDGGIRVTDPDTGLTHVFHSPVAAAADTAVDLPLQYIQDRNGNRITVEYDEGDVPGAVVHSGGYRIALDHDHARSRVTGLRLIDPTHPDRPGTTLLTFAYDEGGHLIEEINSSGLPMRYTYDAEGRITSWTDRNGTTYWYEYDDRGRVIATGGTGNALASTIAYDDATRTTRVTDSLGHTRLYEHNESLRLIRETDPLGNVTAQEWNNHLRLLSVTDPLGCTTRYDYDHQGRVASVTRPDERSIRFTYNDLGLPTTISEPDGTQWRREYDERGNVTAVTDPTGRATTIAYDRTGSPKRIVDALGHCTVIRNSGTGLPTEVTDALGAVSVCERDAFGRPVTLTNPLGARTQLEWTVEGRPSRRTAPDDTQESWLYDGEGNCTQYTDRTGSVSRFEYTHFDLLSARTTPDGARHEFTYDTELRRNRVRNPLGMTWEYEYDAAGRLTTESDFDGRVQRYLYDPAGRLTQRTTPLGVAIRYWHDQLGNVTRKDAAGHVTEYSYDAMGRMLRAAAPDATLERLWTGTGELLAETVTVAGSTARTVAYTYDELGRRTSRTTPSGALSTWEHDAVGNRTALMTSGRRIFFERDEAGREIARRISGGLTFHYDFDELDRLTRLLAAGPEGRLIQERTYRYRVDGHLAVVAERYDGEMEFGLDAIGRVTDVRAGTWQETYEYDAMGNQVSASWSAEHLGPEPSGPREYTGTQVMRAGGIRYEHDSAGRMVLRQKTRLSSKPDTWRYTWDAEDRLSAVVTPDGTRWRYTYDPLGRRVAKERFAHDGATLTERVDFTWDGTTLCEQTTRGVLPAPVTVTWDHDAQRPLAQTERISFDGVPQEEVDSRFYAIVTDLVGTPTELVDEEGNIAWRMRCTVWGAGAWAADSSAYTPLRFPGQYFDPETGLHYNYFRHYDPVTARYASPDPLGLGPAPNPVAYVFNPHVWSDPLGLAPCRVFAVDSNGVARELPVAHFDDHMFPGVNENLSEALARGESPIVERQTGRRNIRRNRRAAQRELHRPGEGMTWEEFPFASTRQGGSGAITTLIERAENNRQGGYLSSFYQKHGIQNGDPFYVDPEGWLGR
ncbi:DUF6531 domain-containing protein [Streptomyces sp. NPDC005209]|uniref:DUF6531 domain-containing protein n=1 Tax=Streptomyces sp. NPDC005209 TaxID=3156715 RepID=UPI0033B573F3